MFSEMPRFRVLHISLVLLMAAAGWLHAVGQWQQGTFNGSPRAATVDAANAALSNPALSSHRSKPLSASADSHLLPNNQIDFSPAEYAADVELSSGGHSTAWNGTRLLPRAPPSFL